MTVSPALRLHSIAGPALVDDPAPPVAIKPLRLRGGAERPAPFEGVLICDASGQRAGAPFWFDIKVFGDGAGMYAATVGLVSADGAAPIHEHAIAPGDFAALADAMESHDPAAAILFRGDAPTGSGPVHAVLRLLGCRLTIEEGRRQYRDLIGEILYAVEPA